MTHPAYATTPELARWLDTSRFMANIFLKKSGLLYYHRIRVIRRIGRTQKWYIIPPTTLRSFLLAKAHRTWQETMESFPPAERRTSPYAAYAGLLRLYSGKPVTPSLPWPFKRPTRQNAAWKKLTRQRHKRRSRASAATSS